MLATWGCTTFPKPTIDLQFAGATSLDNRITFTRATTATFFNSSGVLSTAASGEARFDYNPTTLAAQGLLIEEQRTNSIRNNTGQGAVAGTPGTLPTNWIGAAATDLTREIVGTGTENGITYIDLKYSGTVSASRTQFIFFEPSNGISASNGQSWAGSAWVKLVAGSLNNITSVAFQIDTRDSSLVYVSTPFVAAFTPTSTFTRYSGSGTATGATIAWIQPFVRFITASSGAIDITLRIGLPQLELGAFATSVIPTTTTALTRNADAASMTGTNFSSWYNASEGTLYAEGFVYTAPANTVIPCLFSIDDNTSSNRIQLYRANNNGSPNAGLAVVNGGSIQALITAGNTQFQNGKIAGAYKVNNFAASLNGAAAVTDTTGTIPTVTQMQIGTGPALANVNGTIRRIAYYPVRLANTTLQALTA